MNCQSVGLGISSVTDCGVYACEVSKGRTAYLASLTIMFSIVKCQKVWLGISSVTHHCVNVFEVSKGSIGYI